MNKAIYLCAAATLALASCSNDETVEIAQQKGISFRTVAGLSTRGVETTQANLSSMFVTAYEDGADAAYYSNVEYTREGTGNTFVSNPQYNWLKGKTINFLALSPQATDWPVADATNAVTFDKGTNKFEATFSDVTPKDDVSNQKDLLIGNVSGTENTSAAGLALTLNHVLSQIQIQAKHSNNAYTYHIKGVRIASVVGKGDYKLSTGWDVVTDRATATLKTYDVILDQPIELDGTVAGGNFAVLMKGSADKGYDNAMLIPQQLTEWGGDKDHSGDDFDKGTYISLLLNVKTTNGGTYLYPSKATADTQYGWAAIGIGTKWEAGKKYIYTLDISNGCGKVDPVDPVDPDEDPNNPTVKPGTDDPDKGEKIFGDPIKFDVTVTEWDNTFEATTDSDLKM